MTNLTSFQSLNDTALDRHDHGNETQIYLPRVVFVGMILCTIDGIAIIGNATILVAIYQKQYLQTITNLFIASLACADLGVAVLVLPVVIYLQLFPQQRIFVHSFCHAWLAFDLCFATASILNLCTIAGERYCAIIYPLEYLTKMTKKVACVIIVAVWTLSCLISFPFISYWQKKDYVISDDIQGAGVCIIYLDNLTYIVTSIISYFIPMLVLLIMYRKIHHTALAQAQKMKKNSVALTDIIHQTNLKLKDEKSGGNGSTNATSLSMLKEHKATLVVGVIIGVFIMCWTPFFTHNIIKIFCSKCIVNPTLTPTVLVWLGYTNSSLNPFIYGITSRKFRQAFYELYCKRRWKFLSLILSFDVLIIECNLWTIHSHYLFNVLFKMEFME